MYKSKLQILCQRHSWGLPEYTTTKCGHDHNPSFTATVTVNGLPFNTPDESRNSKEAQNKAAKIAFEHLSSVGHYFAFPQPSLVASPSSPPVPASSGLDVIQSITGISQATTVGAIQTPLVIETLFDDKDDMRHLYKNQLQNYAQKRNLPLPEYSTEREGPPHASRFKSKVTIDGKSYESPEFTPTLKEAEHAAAKVALESLSVNEVREDDSGLYKNLLQELAQKGGLDGPIYETNVSGPPHKPTFVSTVVISGQPFEGQAAKSKKQAETNAAKVAYTSLQERRASVMPLNLSSGSQIKKALEASSSILQSVIAGDLQQSSGPKADLITRKEQSKEAADDVFPGDLQQTAEPTATLVIQEEQDKDYIAAHKGKCSSNLTTSNAEVNNHHVSPPPPDADINSKRHRCSTPADIIHASLRDPFPSTCSSLEDGLSLPSVHSESSKNSILDSHKETPMGAAEGKNAKPGGRIEVRPRMPNMTIPEGATVLPFSDDKWVAIQMNPSQQ